MEVIWNCQERGPQVMSRHLFAYVLLAFLGVGLHSPTPLTAQAWSPAQQEVIDALQEYARVSMTGNVEEIMSFFHPQFSAWDYAQEQPLNREGFQESLRYYFTTYRQTSFDIQPDAIQLRGKIAIAHLHYQEVFTDQAGVDTPMSGRWTAVMLKERGGWVFLAWLWFQDKGPVD
jgi:ketosteroid isomerase-like protein